MGHTLARWMEETEVLSSDFAAPILGQLPKFSVLPYVSGVILVKLPNLFVLPYLSCVILDNLCDLFCASTYELCDLGQVA